MQRFYSVILNVLTLGRLPSPLGNYYRVVWKWGNNNYLRDMQLYTPPAIRWGAFWTSSLYNLCLSLPLLLSLLATESSPGAETRAITRIISHYANVRMSNAAVARGRPLSYTRVLVSYICLFRNATTISSLSRCTSTSQLVFPDSRPHYAPHPYAPSTLFFTHFFVSLISFFENIRIIIIILIFVFVRFSLQVSLRLRPN